MRFTIFQDSRKGSRKVNQDRIAYTYGRDTLLLVVADGMGGHAGGEIAAQICARLFIERFQQRGEAGPEATRSSSCRTRCCARTRRWARTRASSRCWRRRARPASPASSRPGSAYWAHVGDSRLYLFRQGRLDRADQGPLEGPVPRRPGHHRRDDVAPRTPTATRSSAASAGSSTRSSTCRAGRRCATATSSSCAPTACGG